MAKKIFLFGILINMFLLILLVTSVSASITAIVPEGEHICENKWDKASALALIDIIKDDNKGIGCQISRFGVDFDGVGISERGGAYLYTNCRKWEHINNFNYYQGNPCENRPFAYKDCEELGEAKGLIGANTGKKYSLKSCVDGADTKDVRGATKQDLEDVVSERKHICEVSCDTQPKRYSASDFPLLIKRWWKTLLLYLVS